MSKQTDTGTDCQELQARYDALLAESAEQNAKLEAISKVQATIEFDLDGNVLTANSNFLKVLGYSMEEIQGRHHRMFVHPDEVNRLLCRIRADSSSFRAAPQQGGRRVTVHGPSTV
ncbi:MAG: PAS domain S-box protein [Polyangiaceae bacterium]